MNSSPNCLLGKLEAKRRNPSKRFVHLCVLPLVLVAREAKIDSILLGCESNFFINRQGSFDLLLQTKVSLDWFHKQRVYGHKVRSQECTGICHKRAEETHVSCLPDILRRQSHYSNDFLGEFSPIYCRIFSVKKACCSCCIQSCKFEIKRALPGMDCQNVQTGKEGEQDINQHWSIWKCNQMILNRLGRNGTLMFTTYSLLQYRQFCTGIELPN